MERVSTALKVNGLLGWELVRARMDAQLEADKTTPQDWSDELNGIPFQALVLAKAEDPSSRLFPICTVNPSKEFSPLETSPGRTKIPVLYERPSRKKSWSHYLRWRDKYAGQPVPAWISRMRTDQEHEAWAAGGYLHHATWADELARTVDSQQPEGVTS